MCASKVGCRVNKSSVIEFMADPTGSRAVLMHVLRINVTLAFEKSQGRTGFLFIHTIDVTKAACFRTFCLHVLLVLETAILIEPGVAQPFGVKVFAFLGESFARFGTLIQTVEFLQIQMAKSNSLAQLCGLVDRAQWNDGVLAIFGECPRAVMHDTLRVILELQR